MSEEAQPPRQFRQYLAVGGPLPGIPGIHAPGLYDIDYEARTATLVSQELPGVEEEAAPIVPAPIPPRPSNGG